MEPLTATLTFTVTTTDTAAEVGSGTLAVLGTPRLLAWCEAATCAALEPTLGLGETSVGTRVDLEHLAASPVGAEVEVSATSTYVDGRLHRFTVAAHHTTAAGRKLIGTGEITRVVVAAERFMARLG
jgi:fluoroacetyl-CoA thioesterase